MFNNPEDHVSDQNVFASANIMKQSTQFSGRHNQDDQESFFSRSPTLLKGTGSNIFRSGCLTESKQLPMTPFQDSTRSNIQMNSAFNTEKKTINTIKINQKQRLSANQSEDQGMRCIKEKHEQTEIINSKLSAQNQKQNSASNFYGDRFIPCRFGHNAYELQFQHEEHLLSTRGNYSGNQNAGGNDYMHSNADGSNQSMNQDGTQSSFIGTNGQSQGTSGSNTAQNAGDQNQQIYSNLLQTQCLDGSFYYNENSYQNLSYFGGSLSGDVMMGSSSHLPVGLFSNNISSSGIQSSSGLIGASSLNQTISMMMKTKKSIFKYKQKIHIQCENNAPFQVTPLLNIDTNEQISPSVKSTRKIPKMPFKVLDAPQLQDDFYLNLVDWSSSNILAVGLGRAVYIWSACTSRVTKLCEVPQDDSITSVGWNQRGTHLAVGTNSGDTQIWDTTHCKLVRTLSGHLSRVGCVAWSNSIVSTGSRDRNILQRDLRAQNPVVMKLVGHKQEVCGLKWSFDDMQLASGGNDNKLMVWSLQGGEQPLVKFSDHTAAVKAIGWSPHQNGLLASGGGTADRCIRFWNTHTLQPINYIDTGSQVCNLMFSKNVNEIVSTHGYSLNQIILWKYPSMQKVATLTGHTYRVLYLSMSPDGQNIVTGAGDETLRFWSAFPSTMKAKSASDYASFGGGSSMSQLFPSSMDIR